MVDKSTRGRQARKRGMHAEWDFARRIGGKRVPYSGGIDGYNGDVTGLGLTWECKVRDGGFKSLYTWLDGVDALSIKAKGKPFLVVLPLATFLKGWNADGESDA